MNTGMSTATELPDYDDLPLRAGLRASWGVWGDDDRLGCLNLLTPERAVAAARLVERGVTFALNWSMGLPDPPLFDRASYRHEVTGDDTTVSHDDVLHGWNTQSSSQWDGFRHIRHPAAQASEPGTGHYNGIDDGDHGMDVWAQRGLVGRGVLADIGRWREAQGKPIDYDSAEAVPVSDLMGCLADQNTVVQTGDVLLVRFGWVEWYEAQDEETRARLGSRATFAAPGFDSSEELARTLWNLHIAAIGCDNPAVEAWPPAAGLTAEQRAELRNDPHRIHDIFCHTRLIPMLGLPLGEMFNLGALAADCATDGRYEFLFTSAPLNLPAGVASPPNALAVK